jgi:hypothetical protein
MPTQPPAVPRAERSRWLESRHHVCEARGIGSAAVWREPRNFSPPLTSSCPSAHRAPDCCAIVYAFKTNRKVASSGTEWHA